MEVDKAIQERKSVRHFSEKKPSWKEIIECIDSARFSPMAGNIFTLKFILVDDEKKIKKLAEASQQDFIVESKYVVVVCTDSSLTLNAYEERGEKYLRQQAGASIENLLLSLQAKGLSTCWIGHFVDSLVREALGIPEGIEVEAMFPIGYEPIEKGKAPRKKKKIMLDSVLYFNKWKNKRMKSVEKLNV